MIDILVKAQHDLDKKLALERRLKKKLNVFHKSVVADMVAEYQASGNQINMLLYDSELNEVLSDHYKEVSARFRGSVADELPDDVAMTAKEKAAIVAALAAFFLQKAKEQTRLINETTQKNVSAAVLQAQNDELARDQTDVGFKLTVGLLAGAVLRDKLKTRAVTISNNETNLAAEVTKATESEVLAGLEPTIITQVAATTKAKKEWISIGDSKVRDAHLAADGQIQDIGTPYNVGFELLMIPKDASLGASLANIINCRCVSVAHVDSIIDVRRGDN